MYSDVDFLIAGTQSQYLQDLVMRGDAAGNFNTINPIKMKLGQVDFNIVLSSNSKYFLLEFKPTANWSQYEIHKRISLVIREMLKEKSLAELVRYGAWEVKKITEYERVMIYQFAKDGHFTRLYN
ncbi:MAG: hypothetical protein ABIR15_14705 [Chitinophagaceae bacterium]